MQSVFVLHASVLFIMLILLAKDIIIYLQLECMCSKLQYKKVLLQFKIIKNNMQINRLKILHSFFCSHVE